MYESPITLMVKEMAERVAKQQDEMVFSAVQSVMPTVNREELIRALRYDRGQYDKGYADGKRDAMDELVRCRDCANWHCFMNNPDGTMFGSCDLCGGSFRNEDDFCSYGERKDGDG